MQAPTRVQVLSLYRQFLKSAKQLPTAERRDLVKKRVRHEFRKGKVAPAIVPEDAIGTEMASPAETSGFLYEFGLTQLENLQAQVQHLRQLRDQPLVVPLDIYTPSKPRPAVRGKASYLFRTEEWAGSLGCKKR
ncbi:uncharacterized protein BJ171DRAFT_484648 [Polychytrium aggregatum]|uniref:uncharacterized protein n=1 Tax=Polychytrium aggregatum TaxID=110093 RepID=UPI0022FE0F35|nr:uncharacterized protein BJ171DRAFT_484648 [Polychytrium aggregatum]KAI9209654.1 hypothetical protein BJ171DRAFT_484648 [Polychytrium aggregatum]